MDVSRLRLDDLIVSHHYPGQIWKVVRIDRTNPNRPIVHARLLNNGQPVKSTTAFLYPDLLEPAPINSAPN